MLKKMRILIGLVLIFCSVCLAWAEIPSEPLEPSRDHRLSTRIINKFVTQLHYIKSELNDERSEAIFDRYFEVLDPNRSVFTAADIVYFEKYKKRLDNFLKDAKLEPAFEIFRLFQKRRQERSDYAIGLLKDNFNFNKVDDYVIDRAEGPWPKDKNELDALWRQRVKNDILNLRLDHKTEKEIKNKLSNRYKTSSRRFSQYNSEDVFQLLMNAYLHTLEPHTAYFSPRVSENFKIDMSLSLEGIGAVLKGEDEYTVVQKIIPGGPADLSGKISADDKITGVGQGRNGEIIEVIGWRLDDVVDLIRGPKGTVVRLHLENDKSGSSGKIILITRNKIKLESQAAHKELIKIPKTNRKMGLITIPTFYLDFEAYEKGDPDYRSTTRDVARLMGELEQEGVEGIVIDLRGNGGGSLSEAISLTGLFITSGPVVQVRETSGKLKLNNDPDDSIAYNGPLAVLVNGYSASASEIFAGAIQDYKRGIIIGEPTFGKGTVQTIIDLNRYAIFPGSKLGQLKITMAQFFRINGDSTQFRGVIPDINFPTASTAKDRGERAYDNAIPWAAVKPAKFNSYGLGITRLDLLIEKHKSRIAIDPGFRFLSKQAKKIEEIRNQKIISLQESIRKNERENNKKEQLAQLNQFRSSRGLSPMTDLDDDDALKEEDNSIKSIMAREAAFILEDMIDLQKQRVINRLTQKKPYPEGPQQVL
ncbi:Tail-specific protease precursor [hydrothermal vent metagenome]|uniref:Tail-specific protease n=1 Tax=hydrothermal vent metagenome TaxID=652676 RepID=A0A3B0YXF5_9ZZZZ